MEAANEPLLTWNQFQAAHRGLYRQREMATAWAEYKAKLATRSQHAGCRTPSKGGAGTGQRAGGRAGRVPPADANAAAAPHASARQQQQPDSVNPRDKAQEEQRLSFAADEHVPGMGKAATLEHGFQQPMPFPARHSSDAPQHSNVTAHYDFNLSRPTHSQASTQQQQQQQQQQQPVLFEAHQPCPLEDSDSPQQLTLLCPSPPPMHRLPPPPPQPALSPIASPQYNTHHTPTPHPVTGAAMLSPPPQPTASSIASLQQPTSHTPPPPPISSHMEGMLSPLPQPTASSIASSQQPTPHTPPPQSSAAERAMQPSPCLSAALSAAASTPWSAAVTATGGSQQAPGSLQHSAALSCTPVTQPSCTPVTQPSRTPAAEPLSAPRPFSLASPPAPQCSQAPPLLSTALRSQGQPEQRLDGRKAPGKLKAWLNSLGGKTRSSSSNSISGDRQFGQKQGQLRAAEGMGLGMAGAGVGVEGAGMAGAGERTEGSAESCSLSVASRAADRSAASFSKPGPMDKALGRLRRLLRGKAQRSPQAQTELRYGSATTLSSSQSTAELRYAGVKALASSQTAAEPRFGSAPAMASSQAAAERQYGSGAAIASSQSTAERQYGSAAALTISQLEPRPSAPGVLAPLAAHALGTRSGAVGAAGAAPGSSQGTGGAGGAAVQADAAAAVAAVAYAAAAVSSAWAAEAAVAAEAAARLASAAPAAHGAASSGAGGAALECAAAPSIYACDRSEQRLGAAPEAPASAEVQLQPTPQQSPVDAACCSAMPSAPALSPATAMPPPPAPPGYHTLADARGAMQQESTAAAPGNSSGSSSPEVTLVIERQVNLAENEVVIVAVTPARLQGATGMSGSLRLGQSVCGDKHLRQRQLFKVQPIVISDPEEEEEQQAGLGQGNQVADSQAGAPFRAAQEKGEQQSQGQSQEQSQGLWNNLVQTSLRSLFKTAAIPSKDCTAPGSSDSARGGLWGEKAEAAPAPVQRRRGRKPKAVAAAAAAAGLGTARGSQGGAAVMDPRVAALPLYRLVPGSAVRPREAIPHNDARLFSGFGAWMSVDSRHLRAARANIPFQPGLYEWGAVAPGGITVTAFYLGKAGTLCQPQLLSRRRKSGKESLRSRFNKYAVAGRPLGPEREPDKMALFVELQRRGFGLMYRYRVCEDVEPVYLETSLLTAINYSLNLQNNGCRRALMIEGCKSLASFPVVHTQGG